MLHDACCDASLHAGTVLLSKQQQEDRPGAKPRALVLHVGGDTLHALAQLLQGVSSYRPMALDLLWQVCQPSFGAVLAWPSYCSRLPWRTSLRPADTHRVIPCSACRSWSEGSRSASHLAAKASGA